jgi:hypothetical protein
MFHSTSKTRALRRTFWNHPATGLACKAWDNSYLFFLAAVFMVLGSINL